MLVRWNVTASSRSLRLGERRLASAEIRADQNSTQVHLCGEGREWDSVEIDKMPLFGRRQSAELSVQSSEQFFAPNVGK